MFGGGELELDRLKLAPPVQQYGGANTEEIRTKYGGNTEEIRSKYGGNTEEIRSKYGGGDPSQSVF
jgi:hypothetical protein